MRKFFRPFSFGFFALSVPISYVLFVSTWIAALMIVEQTFFNVADGIFIFSIVYAYTCYVWILATWLILSILGRFVLARRARNRPDEQSGRSYS